MIQRNDLRGRNKVAIKTALSSTTTDSTPCPHSAPPHCPHPPASTFHLTNSWSSWHDACRFPLGSCSCHYSSWPLGHCACSVLQYTLLLPLSRQSQNPPLSPSPSFSRNKGRITYFKQFKKMFTRKLKGKLV